MSVFGKDVVDHHNFDRVKPQSTFRALDKASKVFHQSLDSLVAIHGLLWLLVFHTALSFGQACQERGSSRMSTHFSHLSVLI